ncbi:MULTISPECIES: hypothetical protein [unclassified Methanoculleus]|uniref:hypothetical protein n=1 Tax=unclassified Methanoculleus TaxID=2619537 RepID=UPI00319E1868
MTRVLETEKPEFLPPLQYRKERSSPWTWHSIFKLPSGEIASFMIGVSDAVREEAEAPFRACEAYVAQETDSSETNIYL